MRTWTCQTSEYFYFTVLLRISFIPWKDLARFFCVEPSIKILFYCTRMTNVLSNLIIIYRYKYSIGHVTEWLEAWGQKIFGIKWAQMPHIWLEDTEPQRGQQIIWGPTMTQGNCWVSAFWLSPPDSQASACLVTLHWRHPALTGGIELSKHSSDCNAP